MADTQNKKLVFIDTNEFISCLEEQLEGLNFEVLNKIFGKMESKEMILVLPENIRAETFYSLEEKFSILQNKIVQNLDKIIKDLNNDKNNDKNKKILESSLEKSKKTSLELVMEKYIKIKDTIEKIFNHNETKQIKISNDLLLAGMQRAVLKRPPFTNPLKLQKDRENSYIKDQDCIAFEAILFFLESNKDYKNSRLILCTSDTDFWELGRDQLDPQIQGDLDRLCNKAVSYRNLLVFLNEEFKEKYSEKEIEDYQELQLKINEPTSTAYVIGMPITLSSISSYTRAGNIGSSGYLSNNIPDTKVCSNCGVFFRELEENSSIFCGGSLSTLSMSIPPEETLCQRCRKKI